MIRAIGRLGGWGWCISRLILFGVDVYPFGGKADPVLPFNQGRELGAGNPPNPDGHGSAYLWERVWSRDAWLDILGRFVHVESLLGGLGPVPTVIFPRFHQWDAVRRLEADAKVSGAGRNYLVQHSGGVGQVELDRLVGASVLVFARPWGPQGV